MGHVQPHIHPLARCCSFIATPTPAPPSALRLSVRPFLWSIVHFRPARTVICPATSSAIQQVLEAFNDFIRFSTATVASASPKTDIFSALKFHVPTE